ncbi:hypothetical protein IMSAG013_00964 [Clostridiales bacterium]|nr:hypothetical protein IMSAG013_00964 [Clostridiales bacterium]
MLRQAVVSNILAVQNQIYPSGLHSHFCSNSSRQIVSNFIPHQRTVKIICYKNPMFIFAHTEQICFCIQLQLIRLFQAVFPCGISTPFDFSFSVVERSVSGIIQITALYAHIGIDIIFFGSDCLAAFRVDIYNGKQAAIHFQCICHSAGTVFDFNRNPFFHIRFGWGISIGGIPPHRICTNLPCIGIIVRISTGNEHCQRRTDLRIFLCKLKGIYTNVLSAKQPCIPVCLQNRRTVRIEIVCSKILCCI